MADKDDKDKGNSSQTQNTDPDPPVRDAIKRAPTDPNERSKNDRERISEMEKRREQERKHPNKK